MKTTNKLFALGSFVGLSLVAVLAFARLGRPSIAGMFVWAVVLATAAGAPGLVKRRAWPLALALLPLGAYLLLRLQMPAPADMEGAGAHVTFYVEQLRSGMRTYARHGFPLDLTTAGDLKLLLSLAVYLLVGVAAFAALSLRRPVPAIALLIVPLGFGLTVDKIEKTLALPLAYLVLAGCLLLSTRALRRNRWTTGDTVAGLGTATVAALIALSALGATSVAASEPWRDWRTWDIDVAGEARFVFDSMSGYGSLLDPANDAEVMRVRSPVPSYWRANALSGFDGVTWFSGALRRTKLRAEEAGSGYSYTVPLEGPIAPGTSVRQSFELRSVETDYFFTGGTAQQLDFAREVPVHTTSTYALGVERPLGPTLYYSVQAIVPKVWPGDLIARGREYPPEVWGQMELPFVAPYVDYTLTTEGAWREAMKRDPIYREWLGLYRLNEEMVGDATDPYEIALRIESYLRENYEYSLSPKDVRGTSVYATFLFKTKEGYCQHFAGSMAALLRFNGIPARVAVGFATGTSVSHSTYVVRRSDAHAWVEAYFPDVGWVMFEPTPGRATPGAGVSSTSVGFSDPFVAGFDPADAADPARAGDLPRGLRETDGAGGAAATPALPDAETSRSLLPWVVAGALAALLVAWPLGRALLRRRGLRRGDPERRLRAALALILADLADFGYGVPRSWTLEETGSFIERRLGLDAGSVVERAQAVLFGGRAATDDDVAAVTALSGALMRRLRDRAGRRRTILALYGLHPRRDAASDELHARRDGPAAPGTRSLAAG